MLREAAGCVVEIWWDGGQKADFLASLRNDNHADRWWAAPVDVVHGRIARTLHRGLYFTLRNAAWYPL